MMTIYKSTHSDMYDYSSDKLEMNNKAE